MLDGQQQVAYRKRLAEREGASKPAGGPGQHRLPLPDHRGRFLRAIERYHLVAQPLHLALFRPRLKPAFQFGPGRAINVDPPRSTTTTLAPYAKRVGSSRRRGDHDSMVLEPNVRILAAGCASAWISGGALPAQTAQAGTSVEKPAAPVELSL